MLHTCGILAVRENVTTMRCSHVAGQPQKNSSVASSHLNSKFEILFYLMSLPVWTNSASHPVKLTNSQLNLPLHLQHIVLPFVSPNFPCSASPTSLIIASVFGPPVQVLVFIIVSLSHHLQTSSFTFITLSPLDIFIILSLPLPLVASHCISLSVSPHLCQLSHPVPQPFPSFLRA